jgi:outer membrane protein assembly factor BamB
MLKSLKPIAALVVAVCFGSAVSADDWPQWLGPRRDGVWRETGVLKKFPADGPKVRWRSPVSGGYAGPSIADGRVFVADYVLTKGEPKSDPGAKPLLEGEERLQCFNLKTGEREWEHHYSRTYEISYPAGPRATPTVSGDKVYFAGAEGNLTCLAVKDGAVVWDKDLKKEYNAPTPMWGFCGHPLVDGDHLFVTAGGPGSIALCLDKNTGQEIWRSLTAKDAGYCPPTMIEVGGEKQLVIWTPESLNSLKPDSGEVNWTMPLEPSFGMSIVAPMQTGNHLFAAGIENVGVMLTLAPGMPPKVDWTSRKDVGLAPVNSPVLAVGDVMYGVDRQGELTAVQIETGKQLWQTFAATTGTRRASSATAFLTRNDDLFYILSETGDLIIAKLSPEKYEELSRAHVIEPTHDAFGRKVEWSAPAFADKCCFVRNNQEVICLDLAE